ncbi:MAG: alcohol dehydrogenase catalytic domain-containing protein [Streptosporangiales bacterium]|nr:alcohol dehydrogenase catalytic domain-containing protein [Streptosporangiales bacterium]
MRARWIERWDGPLLDGERPKPRPGSGEVLVAVEACGVGLTVLNCIRGNLGDDPADLPRIPGHELVGTVAEVGPGVDPDWVGRRAMAYFYLLCARCRRCLAGAESMCERLAGHVGVHRDGGYAEWTVLPERNVVPLPEGIEATAATVIPDAIATPVHVAGRARIRPGERVAVIAAGGGVGIHMVQVARVYGAEVAGLEASAEKLDYLERVLGVPAADSTDFAGVRLPAGWGDGPDVVVDLLGTEASLEWGLRTLGPDGRLVLLTTFPGRTVSVSPREMVFRQQTVVASRYASRSELMFGARLVAEERVRPVVGRVAGPGDVDGLHDALRRGDLLGRGALTWTDRQ